jgi:hypothetical protein
VQSLAARRFAEGNKADVSQSNAQFVGRIDHAREFDVRPRIEIEDETARHVGLERLAIPGVEFERRDLPKRDETLDAVDFDIGLAVAGN